VKKIRIPLLRACLLLILPGFSLLSSAQNDYRKGYIIPNTGDTVFGMINYQGDIKNSEECNFQFETGRIVTFYPADIKGYRFEGGKFYVSRYIVEKEKVTRLFAEYLVRGQKDLFYFRNSGGTSNFLLSINDSSLIRIPYEEKIETIHGKQYMHVSTMHIGFLKTYFSDCPDLFDKIERIKKPELKNMITITKDYHDEVCGENSCIIYKKSRLPVKIGIQPRLEITRDKIFSGSFTQYGAVLSLWLPQTNEKLYFKTGYLYSNPENSYTMYKIPIQFEFVSAEKIIRPKFDVGFNYYKFKNQEFELMQFTFAPAAGVLIRASRYLYFDIDFETDLINFSFENKVLTSYSYGAGLLLYLQMSESKSKASQHK
jgi:hypothetical protein